jgi:hypothetical protein
MDKTKAVLEEIDLKAANASNAYELIMNLIKETSLPQALPAQQQNRRHI